MIKRKKGLISLKKNFDLNRQRESRRTKIEADKAASVGDELKEKNNWDSINSLLHQFF